MELVIAWAVAITLIAILCAAPIGLIAVLIMVLLQSK